METSIFIVPRASTAWRGNEAGWITASGWAAAGKQLWGEALLATRDGVFGPEESRLFPRGELNPKRRPSALRKYIPEFLITAYKDYHLWRSIPPVWPIEDSKWWMGKNVKLIWERHDLFAGPGRRLADRLGVPLVTSVEAVVVWEAQRWGVHRPVHGKMLERREAASLKRSDLVLCVSEEVRKKVLELGTDPHRTVVTPNRVDSTLFHAGVTGERIRKQFGLEGKRVIGWTGSFRKFHGLPTVIAAFATVHQLHPDTVLVLVGDGQEMDSISRLAEEFGVGQQVIFTGRQPFTAVPSFVAAFDLGLVTAATSEDFHYSPLKLREYLALGKAIIAPCVGDLPSLFRTDQDMIFYKPGDAVDLHNAMLRILENPALKNTLEASARLLPVKNGTWVHELSQVYTQLRISGSAATRTDL